MKTKFIILSLSFLYFQLNAEAAFFKKYEIDQGLVNVKISAITQDNQGFMWIGTNRGLFKFDGLSFFEIDSTEMKFSLDIRHLHVMANNSILIATKDHGLFIQTDNTLSRVNHKHLNEQTIYNIAKVSDDQLWLATESGLFQFSNNEIKRINIKVIEEFNHGLINMLKRIDEEHMAIGKKNHLYIYNLSHQSLIAIQLEKETLIHDVYKDRNNILWVATSSGLQRFEFSTQKPLLVPKLIHASRILSIKPHKNDVWIASIDGGLIRINIKTLDVEEFMHDPLFTNSLPDNNLISLYISQDDTLWAGGFYSGLSSLNLKLENFNFETRKKNSIHCAKNSLILSIETDDEQSLWLGTSEGLIYWNKADNICLLIDQHSQIESSFSVYGTRLEQEKVWIASSIGLMSYDKFSQKLQLHNHNLPDTPVFFTHRLNKNNILVATSNGLYQYDPISSEYLKAKTPDDKFNNISYTRHYTDKNGQLYIPTIHGLLILDTQNHLQEFGVMNPFFMDKTIEAITVNDQREKFIGVKDFGLYHLDNNNQLIHHYFNEIYQYRVLQLQLDDNRLWTSTDHGLLSIELDSNTVQHYSSEAYKNYLTLNKCSHKDNNGQIYFGGNNGLIHFDPQELSVNYTDYPLVFNQLYLMDQPVKQNNPSNTGFILNKSIDQTNELIFSHKDTLISLNFIQPNYQNPKSTEYQYKLTPISSNWLSLTKRDQHLTFSNLKSGRYQLEIKAQNFNSSRSKSIQFIVKSPPWLSWWAFSIYAVTLMLLIYLFIKRKIANERKLNAYLKSQVKQQTSHIEQQKKVVEDLMARKNEIFSNVSHEFRTPITLILGPMEELLKVEKNPKKKQDFAMVTRNAKRLLDLVNQMLKLAQINETAKTAKQLIVLSSRLNMIIEPFLYLAKLHKISLNIHKLDDIILELTEDALETIISNLLSNAIKYTDTGGDINIGTRLSTDHVEIYVKDNGKGIADADQQKIFKRFERLQDGSAQGIGIGLALVKELVDINHAQLIVNSEAGEGTEFVIKFTIDASLQNFSLSNPHTSLENVNHIDTAILNDKQTVLIIDDNNDMRQYIQQVLSQHFNCLTAVSGTDGISKALRYVPDIVVCDVMMPVIDGFQVCRQLRNDMITSHVPLVLLTAVNEKASRIKGWRANIDRYLSKPFDAQELILQLKNILNTQQLLIKKYHNKQPSTTQPYFSEIDQSFIDRLYAIIEEGYSNPMFNVEKIASLMMVSDRQLQRKIKSLLNRSPLDMLKEIRLKNATDMLTQGKQISLVSDKCGFSNASHFSYAFKKSYGMTPKAYQKLNHKS